MVLPSLWKSLVYRIYLSPIRDEYFSQKASSDLWDLYHFYWADFVATCEQEINLKFVIA